MKPKVGKTGGEDREYLVAAGGRVGARCERMGEQADEEEDRGEPGGQRAEGDHEATPSAQLHDPGSDHARGGNRGSAAVACVTGGGLLGSLAGAGAPLAGVAVFRVLQPGRDLQEPRFERGLDWLEPVDGYSAFDENAADLGDGVAARACGQRDAQPQRRRHGPGAGTQGGAREQGHGPGRVRSIRPQARASPASSSVIGPCRMMRPRSTMATASQVRSTSSRRWRNTRLCGPRPPSRGSCHASRPFRPGRPVRRFVQQEQLGVAHQQAGGDPQALAHPQRRATRSSARRARPARSSAGPMRPRAAGSRAAGRSRRFCLPVRWLWNRGSSTMAPTRASAASRCRGTGYPSRDVVPASGAGQFQQHPDSVVLRGAVGPR